MLFRHSLVGVGRNVRGQTAMSASILFCRSAITSDASPGRVRSGNVSALDDERTTAFFQPVAEGARRETVIPVVTGHGR